MLAAVSILLPDIAAHGQSAHIKRAPDDKEHQVHETGTSFLLPWSVCTKAVASILLPDATVPLSFLNIFNFGPFWLSLRQSAVGHWAPWFVVTPLRLKEETYGIA